jgi:phage shock protein C
MSREDRWERREERREHRRERRQARKEGRAMRHEEHGERRTTLYRSRSGMVCGVCKGFADYYEFNVGWTRIGVLVLASMTGFWPCVIAYVIAAMVMKPEPVLPLESEEDEEFYNSYSGSRTMALNRLKRTYDNLNRRIQRLESAVTARDFDWDERLNR